MAIISKTISQPTPVGLSLPIKSGNNGYFQQTYDTITQTKYNIINLLNTKRGEIRMKPLFGTRLYEQVFDPNTGNMSEICKSILLDDIKMWIPDISIENLEVTTLVSDNNPDTYKVKLSLNFRNNRLNTGDNIVIIIENNRI